MYQIQQAGVSGETVEQMLKRLPKLLKEKEAKSQHFTHIIILGGTNDLASRYKLPPNIHNTTAI